MEQIHQGWLVKSPPERKLGRFLKAKWRRRFFVLHAPPATSSIPGQYKLDYYDNANLKKHIGVIDLDQCEEIIAKLDSVHYKHLFALRTKHKGRDRKYFLAADSDEDMNKWVECLCRVCNFRPDSAEDDKDPSGSSQHSVSVAELPIPSTTAPTSPPSTHTQSSPRHHAGVRKNSTPYILLTDCQSKPPGSYSPESSPLERVPPAPRSSTASIDSIPDVAPPPPPIKRGPDRQWNEVPQWDPNQTYDLPKHNYTNLSEEPYNVPPRRHQPENELHKVPPTCNLEFRQDDEWYNVPPRRQVQTDSVYNVPRPLPQTKAASPRDSGSSNGSHTSQKQDSAYESGDTYDYPKKLSMDVQSVDHLTERIRSSSLVQGHDFYDTPGPRKALSASNILDRVPPPPRPPKTDVPVAEEGMPYENLPLNSKSHPAYPGSDSRQNFTSSRPYDVPPPKPSDAVMLAMSPPPPRPCMMVDHGYVNDPKRTNESFYMPMQGTPEELYLPMHNHQAGDRSSEIYTPMGADRESIYVAPPSNRPVTNRAFTKNPNATTPAPRLQRLGVQTNTGGDGVGDPYIFTTHRTQSFKRQINRPEIPLPTKRGNVDSSSSDDDDSDSIGSHDKSMDSSRGTPPTSEHPLPPKKSLKSTPPPPKKSSHGEVQYLDLCLEDGSDVERSPVFPRSPPPGNASPTDYKEIDFVKTKALSETKKDLENKRKSSEKSVDE